MLAYDVIAHSGDPIYFLRKLVQDEVSETSTVSMVSFLVYFYSVSSRHVCVFLSLSVCVCVCVCVCTTPHCLSDIIFA